MPTYGFISLLPPLLTIALALLSKRVLPSLFAGVLASHVVLTWPNPLAAPFAAMDQMIATSTNRGNFLLIVFSLMVGGLLQLIRDGRGFEAFAAAVGGGRNGKRRAFGLTTGIGVGMFLDCWSNVLVNGATNRPLYDRLGISPLRLAYYIHTIAICVVAMATLNGWGAFYMGLLNTQHVAQPFAFIVQSIPYMLYNWASLALVFLVMTTGWAIGPMRRFDAEAIARFGAHPAPASEDDASGPQPRISIMVLPLATLVVTVFAALYVTGGRNILAGDAGLSITYGVLLASAVAAFLLIIHGVKGVVAVEESYVNGMARFFDVGVLIVLALSIGDLTRLMGTGAYLSQLVQGTVPIFTLPALVFLLGAAMSFATGTSYGTFSIMVPIALPMAQMTGLDPHLMFGAVIAGGLFGDNSSPISDTTIMTTIGAEVPIVDHVATQLPYALISAAVALVGFLLLGAFG